MDSFQALVVDKVNGEVDASTRLMSLADLPEGDLLIKVAYSSVNYKDALACSANGNIVKNYPFVPGIDLAGVVVSCGSGRFREGDQVIVTGYKLGVSHYGGFSGYARIPSEWAVKLPDYLSLKEAMIMGTAGFTAALSVLELQQQGIRPDSGPVLVTGASGGVGTIAVAILAKLGYEVVASTGKKDMKDDLLGLGAQRVISRDEVVSDEKTTLGKQLWAGAVDCVGGKTLSSILSNLQYGGAVAASGLTGGTALDATVFPFILRGVRLIGIDSVFADMTKRLKVWELVSSEYKPAMLDRMCVEISLEQVPDYVPKMLQGQARGRLIVKL